MAGAERPFRDILAAACLLQCPVPISCPIQIFDNEDGTKTAFEIADGKCSTVSPPPEPPETEPPTYDTQVSVGRFPLTDDGPFTDDLNAISVYFQDVLTRFFNSQVLDLTLTFGLIDDGHVIALLDGSATTTMNGFTANLFLDIPGGESALTSFITESLSSEWNGRHCVTGSPECTVAGYQCPRIFVILYRAHHRFPALNEARLYRLLKSRFQSIDPDFGHELANVCIGCLHVYTAEEREYQAQKAANRLPPTMDPPLFEALVPMELAARGKSDVGMTPKGIAPYSYYINLRDSPYRTSPVPNRVPGTRTAMTPVRPIPRSEPWVDRLFHSAVTPSIKCAETVTEEPFKTPEPLGPRPWMRPTGVSYSQKLAPRAYASVPFTYEFLERVRERANRNVRRSQKFS